MSATRRMIAHSILITIATATAVRADTFYVNGSCGNDAWTGTNSVCLAPNGPKLTIQAGINASVNGDTVIVADGTYIGVSNKNLDYGGRLIILRSANGPSVCIIDCENDGRGFIFRNGETADAVLEGFTIRNGRAAGMNGGAIMCWSASNPTISNCTFSRNSANGGGGIFNSHSSPTVTNCTFNGNWLFGTASGGGMYNRDSSSPTVTNCTFTSNTSNLSGGGMSNAFSSSPTVTNCTFSGNSADFRGGGGMANRFRSSPTVTNCTFTSNTSNITGGGMANTLSSPTVTNCIFWNDTPNEIVDVNSAVTTVRFSDVQGGWPGTGNIDADPFFVDPANADYRLASASPCIDAADNTAVPAGILTDLDGNPRFVDDPATPDCQWVPGACGDPPIVDMGAHEFPCDPCDMNCDGYVNAFDIESLLSLLFEYVDPCSPCAGDVNGDGVINAFDVGPFLKCLFP